jgi:flagellin-specific chaperone FliS
LGSNLIELYDYMQRRLIVANVEQSDPPLAEVAQLLATLLEGWMSCQAPTNPWLNAPPPLPAEPTPDYAPRDWSF